MRRESFCLIRVSIPSHVFPARGGWSESPPRLSLGSPSVWDYPDLWGRLYRTAYRLPSIVCCISTYRLLHRPVANHRVQQPIVFLIEQVFFYEWFLFRRLRGSILYFGYVRCEVRVAIYLVTMIAVGQSSYVRRLVSMDFRALVFPFCFMGLVLIGALRTRARPKDVSLIRSFVMSNGYLLFISKGGRPYDVVSFRQTWSAMRVALRLSRIAVFLRRFRLYLCLFSLFNAWGIRVRLVTGNSRVYRVYSHKGQYNAIRLVVQCY